MTVGSGNVEAHEVTPLATVPGDGGPPIVGYTFQYLNGTLLTTRDRYDRYGPVSWMRAFGIRFVNAQGPDACGDVLQNRNRAYASGPGWSYLIGPFFDRGLMLLDFDEHHQHRRIMQQAFTSDRLAAYLGPMTETLGRGIEQWQPSPRFLVYPAMKQLILDVATRTFMGGRLGAEADEVNRAFVDCVRAGTAVLRFPVPGLRWSAGLRGRKKLERFLYPQLPAKRAADDNDIFAALCHARSDDGDQFTDDDVINHMIFLLMAAHDTTTVTMTSMLYYLAKHPQWQERCRAESQAIGADGLPFERIDDLVALDMVMKESMRMITPVPGVLRKTVVDTDLLGFRVPKDTYVSVNLHGNHHLDEYWPEHDRFDPERFSAERRADKVHRHAFLPFGNGVHKCIGMHFGAMQIKATLHRLLLTRRWSVEPGYTMPIDWSSLPRPKDGLPVHLERL